MLTLLAFVVTIGIIVTIHEFGHFQVARWCGVRVLKFSIGFGKSLWQKKIGKDQTEFVLAAIPLGGFVKMLDERELKAEAEANPNIPQPYYTETQLKRAFNRQPVWKRIAIVLAGPLANLLLAILLYWILLMQGETGVRPIVGDVKENSLAAEAAFTKGEVIRKVAGENVTTWQDARWALLEASYDKKTVEIETVSNKNEQHLHVLSFARINNDTEVDILDKLGLSVFEVETPPIVQQIQADGAAAKAAFMVGDKIVQINGTPIKSRAEMVNMTKSNPDKALQFEVLRGKERVKITATPRAEKENKVLIGRLGLALGVDPNLQDTLLIKKHYSLAEGLTRAVGKTWQTSVFSLKMMWYMIVGKASVKGISGPVTIASYAGESADLGLDAFLSFVALVSISVGVLNLLPIPVLDGGHLMYYITEFIKGSPVSEQTVLWGQKIGFVVLGLLMSIAIFNDISRLVVG